MTSSDVQTTKVPILLLVIVYLIVAGGLLYCAYWIFPPKTTDEVKEFGARATVAAAMAGALVGMVVSLYTLKRQLEAGRTLAILQGTISRQNEFVKAALENKSDAYNKIVEAANSCYYELQGLARGEYDEKAVDEEWKKFREARGLVAHLSKDERQVVLAVMQQIMNVKNSAKKVKRRWGRDVAEDYKQIWKDYLKPFGKAMQDLENASPFSSTRVGPEGES